ncbi:MAG: hypothetical protein ACLRI8_08810 [Agathobacter rectalis]
MDRARRNSGACGPFQRGGTDDDYILWNNYYEYSFSQTEHIDFYITATDAQNELMRRAV